MEANYIDHMGDDLRAANAARVSFQKESGWNWIETEEPVQENYVWSNGEKNFKNKLSEADQKLIKYLAKHNHWTPFSHVMITMREKVPIFVARQRFKHMVGFTYNEVSRRYVDDSPEFFTPSVWRSRPDGSVKQGSGTDVIEYLCLGEDGEQVRTLPYKITGSGKVSDAYREYLRVSESLYFEMLRSGIAPEQARMVLPQSMYTEYYVTGSLAAWARAYVLRTDPHAQLEIQQLAILWNEVITGIKGLEHSWKALTNG